MLNRIIKSRKINQSLITNWLAFCLILVLAIILLTTTTRFTNIEMFAELKHRYRMIPIFTAFDWQLAFSKYKEFIELKSVSINMTLSEFKWAYYLQYFNKIIISALNLVFFIPLVILWYKRLLYCYHKVYSLIIAILLIAQICISWHMLKNGSYEIMQVSYYELTAHLMLYVVIYSLLFLQLIYSQHKKLLIPRAISLSLIKRLCVIILFFTYVQITLGYLLANLKGGLIYNSFPLMGDYFVAYEISNSSYSELMLFNEPSWIQFLHRINGYGLLLMVMLLTYKIEKSGVNKLITLNRAIFLTMIIEFLLGIFTLIYSVPVILAFFHQLVAMILLTILLHFIYYFISNDGLQNHRI